MKQWIVVLTLANEFKVFRLVDDPDEKVLRYASIIIDVSELDPEFVIKDRFGMFNPSIHPVVSNSYVHMYIASLLPKDEQVK